MDETTAAVWYLSISCSRWRVDGVHEETFTFPMAVISKTFTKLPVAEIMENLRLFDYLHSTARIQLSSIATVIGSYYMDARHEANIEKMKNEQVKGVNPIRAIVLQIENES